MIVIGSVAFADESIKEICYYPRDFDWGRLWLDWNKGVKKQMGEDLPLIADIGFNTVRLIIQPQIVGYPHPSKEFLADFEDALSLLEKFGLKAHVTLFDFDYFYPHARNEDEEKEELKIEKVIANSKQWIDDFVVTFRNDKRIAVWELYNEIVLYHIRDGIVTKEPVVRSHRWLKEMFPYLKQKVGSTPCTVSVSFVEWLNDIKSIAMQPDIYNLHWYPNDWTGPFLKVLDRAYEIIGKDKRLMIGEFGCNTFTLSEKSQMDEYRNMLYYTNQKGVTDIAIWTFNDFPKGRKKYIINYDGTKKYLDLPDSDLNLGIYKIAEGNVLKPKSVVNLLREVFSGKPLDTAIGDLD
jgi:hypothetical protein